MNSSPAIESFDERLEIFFGDANPAEARVYARLALAPAWKDCRLAGDLVGPTCRHAHTLPATVPFIDRGAEGGMLAEVVLPDPCFWTPELPFLYRARLRLMRGAEELAAVERDVGIRPLGARNRRLYFEGKGWAPRGARRDELPDDLRLDAWRAAACAMVVRQREDALCAEASRAGVLIFAELDDERSLAASLRRLARWPAVAFAVIPGAASMTTETRGLARNLLLAARISGDAAPPPPDWADLLVVDLDQAEYVPDRFTDVALPLVAQRAVGKQPSVEQARAACDALQRALAPRGDFAGYLV